MITFDAPKQNSSIITVMGIGGGGGNAINHMHQLGIVGVDFIICNTDAQALENSPVPNKIHIGKNITEGLGAGADPEVGRNAAIEEADTIKEALSHNTRMLFITAGMGGGTGTGAAPVIAEIAQELNILTIAIVTIPFGFEGRKRQQIAQHGIIELKKHVDAIIVINNDKMIELHGDLSLEEAFAQADDVLATGSKAIAELISKHRKINLDFKDVRAVMQKSGIALMGNGIANGEDRAIKAAEIAMSSPLLDENDIRQSKRALLNISYSKEHQAGVVETSQITEYITEKLGSETDLFFGAGEDNSLGDNLCVTLIATGFKTKAETGRTTLVLGEVNNVTNPETLKSAGKKGLKHEPTLKNKPDESPNLFSELAPHTPQVKATEDIIQTTDNTSIKTKENTSPNLAGAEETNTPPISAGTEQKGIEPITAPTSTPSSKATIVTNTQSHTKNHTAQQTEEVSNYAPTVSLKTDATEFTFSINTDAQPTTTTKSQSQPEIEDTTDTLVAVQLEPVVEEVAKPEPSYTPKPQNCMDIDMEGTIEERIKKMQALSVGKHTKATQNVEAQTVSSDTKEAAKYNMKNNNGKIVIEHTPNGYINKNAD